MQNIFTKLKVYLALIYIMFFQRISSRELHIDIIFSRKMHKNQKKKNICDNKQTEIHELKYVKVWKQ